MFHSIVTNYHMFSSSRPAGGELDVMKRGVLASSSLHLAMRIAEKVVEVVDHYPPDGQ